MKKAIICGSLIDANGVKNDQIVLTENEKIIQVGSKNLVKYGEDFEVLDASDLTVLPGLMDCHVHFEGARQGLNPNKFTEKFEVRLIRAAIQETHKLINAGFTTVMDAGGIIGIYVRNAINEGIMPGPRILASGRYISQTCGHGDTHYIPLDWAKDNKPMGWWPADGRIADGVDECITAVREQFRLGCDFIKILTGGGLGSPFDPPQYPQYTDEELTPMIKISHSWGRKVMCHAHYPETIISAVNAGADLITHCTYADENAIKIMKEKNTIVVPTMANGYHRDPSKSLDNIKQLYDAGLTLALGTDILGYPLGFEHNAIEFEAYVKKIGVTPQEAIKIGTLNCAKAMGRNDIGTIEPGKIADIIAVKGNIMDRIDILQNANNIKCVIKDGAILKNTL